jgi:predicted metal-dependent hydrolase
MHGAVTDLGHNAPMTLFDVSELEPVHQAGGGWDRDADTAPDTDPGAHADPDAHVHTAGALPAETNGAPPEVEVRISPRRRKTSEARWVDGRIVVSLPAHLDRSSRQKTIDWLVQRLLARHPPHPNMGDDALLARAAALSERYLLGVRPASVRWVTNQTARWGSCSYYSGDIRISHRLRPVPAWVLDSVLVHELAHLTYPDHSPAFNRLANSYPRHREAGSFLAGYELGLARPTGH